MRYFIASLILAFSISTLAADQPSESCANAHKPLALNLQGNAPRVPQSQSKTPEAERSGCCSHHNGVCGCSMGTTQCCDGSLSPSCNCN